MYIYIYAIIDMYHVSFNNSVYIYIMNNLISYISNYLWKFSTVLYVYSQHDCDYQTEMHIQVNVSAKQLLEHSACSAGSLPYMVTMQKKKTKNMGSFDQLQQIIEIQH